MDKRLAYGIPAVAVVAILITVAVLNVDSLTGGEEKLILIEFDTSRAGQHVRELIKNGPRMSGSTSEHLGAEYIANQFEDAGLQDVHIEQFTVPMFEVRWASVMLIPYMGPFYNIPRTGILPPEVVSFVHMKDFVLQGYSGSLNWNNFRDDLEVVNIGNGSDIGSYEASSGRICFVEQNADTPPNAELYFYAYEAGARAIILQNVWRGEGIGYLPMFKSNQNPLNYDRYPDIPFFMVSKAMGDEILDRAPEYKVRIDFDVFIGNMPIDVVVGDIKGTRNPDEYVIFGAHHDTCYNTVGVVDNTVGPATLIEIARGMHGYEPDTTIRFCTFGGEEEGLYGSIEYYKAHSGEFADNVDLYINFDMAHVDPDTNRFTITTTQNSTIPLLEDLRDELVESEPALNRYEINIVYDDMMWAASDHWPFTSHGHQAMGGWGSGCEEYHTYADDLTHLNHESLQIGGRILGSYAVMTA
ncbi:MAG: M28 family peptidase [Thermoplasmatota archaeon]